MPVTGGRRIRIHTDGASRGNPGPAGAGALLEDTANGTVLAEIAQYLGRTTNNVAEYQALILGLRRALELGADAVDVVSDSELMVRQVEGRYQVRSPGLLALAREVGELRRKFGSGFQIRHVLRGGNRRADQLANLAIDQGLGRVARPAVPDTTPAAPEPPRIPVLAATLAAGDTSDLGAGMRLVRAGHKWRRAAWILVLEGAVDVGGQPLSAGGYRAGPVRYRAAGDGGALVLEMAEKA